MATKLDTSKDLISRMKPLLSELPINHADIQMDINDVAFLDVRFLVTQDLLDAISGNKDFSHLLPDKMDGV